MWQMNKDVAVTPRALFNANPIIQSRYKKKKNVTKYSAVADSQA